MKSPTLQQQDEEFREALRVIPNAGVRELILRQGLAEPEE